MKTGELDGCGQRRPFLLRKSTIVNRQSSIHYSIMECMRIGDCGMEGTQIEAFSVRCTRVRMERGFRWVSARCAAIQRGKQVACLSVVSRVCVWFA